MLAGTAWQRCRVHFMRNVLAHVPQADKSMVAAAIHTVFAQRDQTAAKEQLREVVRVMEPQSLLPVRTEPLRLAPIH
ncbi:MAG: transposase for insertion sequence element [Chloroflexi bacterium]|nr:transposase for insertion sequence element [Chloroflexota bacterium]